MYDGREYCGFAAQDENGKNNKNENERSKLSRPKKNQFNHGGSSSGYSSKSDQKNHETVERHLSFALGKTRLFVGESKNNDDNAAEENVTEKIYDGLPRLVKSAGYSRCGRTDRGVSALGQV